MLQLSDLTLEDIFLKITMGELGNEDSDSSKPRPRINLVFEGDKVSAETSDSENNDGGED